jgi:hypothetical protein
MTKIGAGGKFDKDSYKVSSSSFMILFFLKLQKANENTIVESLFN